MVQEFHVLRCFTCETFQVQQVKKANRWSCKLCGEKQSLLKEFGRGSAADCRRHVQKLNAAKGAKMEEETWLLWNQLEAQGKEGQVTQTQVSRPQVSRWSKYLDTPEEAGPEEEGEENVLMDRQQLHETNIIHRKRKTRDGQDNQIPGQSNCSSQRHTSPPSQRHTSPPSQRHTSPPSQRHTSPPSQRHTSPPSQRHTIPPILKSKVSRWPCFLSSDCQAEQEEELTHSGRSHSGGVSSVTRSNDAICQAPPPERPRLLLPVSMFESGEDFSWDF